MKDAVTNSNHDGMHPLHVALDRISVMNPSVEELLVKHGYLYEAAAVSDVVIRWQEFKREHKG